MRRIDCVFVHKPSLPIERSVFKYLLFNIFFPLARSYKSVDDLSTQITIFHKFFLISPFFRSRIIQQNAHHPQFHSDNEWLKNHSALAYLLLNKLAKANPLMAKQLRPNERGGNNENENRKLKNTDCAGNHGISGYHGPNLRGRFFPA